MSDRADFHLIFLTLFMSAIFRLGGEDDDLAESRPEPEADLQTGSILVTLLRTFPICEPTF